MKNNLAYLVQQLLKQHAVLIDFDELDFQIQSHPSYPSLHAVTGVLSHFNVENVAIQVPSNKETLTHLPECFLAEIEKDSIKNFVIVNKINDDYRLVFDSKTIEQISETLFLERFTGIIVAVETDRKITDLKTKSKSKDYTKLLASIALLFFIVIFYSLKPNLIISMHFLLSVFGIAISYLIVQQDLGIASKIGDKICSQDRKATNCNAVLNSNGATLFKTIKLSDASIIYFVAMSITSSLLMLSNTTYFVILGISLLAVPVILYSVYYQYAIAKTWCLLCLAVVVILTSQFVLAIIVLNTQIDFSKLYLSLSLLLLVFAATSAIWLFVVSKLKEENNFKLLKVESTKFKRNYTVFKSLLYQNKPIRTTIIDTNEIVFGNANSSLKLLVVTNPFCGFCRDVHNLVETILKKYSEQISITIRFNINTNNEKNELAKITTRLFEIYHEKGEHSCLEAMHHIYNKRDIIDWFNLFGSSNNVLQYRNVLLKEKKWCVENQINFTPALLVNGLVYPKEYKNEDLLFFVDDLFEDTINANSNNLELEIA